MTITLTEKELKKQHEILRILQKQHSLFYIEHQRVKLLLAPEDISEALEISRDVSLKLLTNLVTRGFAHKESGNNWLYVISDEGIQAFLEERLVYESKQVQKDKLNKRTSQIISLIAIAISIATFISNSIRTNTTSKEIMEVKKENQELKNRILAVETRQIILQNK